MTPTLSDDAMLLRAVCDRPDDDAPRRAYADMCRERGDDARADFIECQLELARLDERLCHQPEAAIGDWCNDSLCPKCGKGYALRERERALLSQHGGDWHGITPPPDVRLVGEQARDGVATVFFTRGFPAHVALPVAALCGGECGRCNGGFVWEDYWGGAAGKELRQREVRCSHCHGTGRTGIAAQLARLPLTRVRVAGREPNDYGPPEDDIRFGWLSEHEHGPGPAALPRPLLLALAEVRKGKSCRYPTAAAAIDALNLAALALIRGLNPEAASTKETDTCR